MRFYGLFTLLVRSLPKNLANATFAGPKSRIRKEPSVYVNVCMHIFLKKNRKHIRASKK